MIFQITVWLKRHQHLFAVGMGSGWGCRVACVWGGGAFFIFFGGWEGRLINIYSIDALFDLEKWDVFHWNNHVLNLVFKLCDFCPCPYRLPCPVTGLCCFAFKVYLSIAIIIAFLFQTFRRHFLFEGLHVVGVFTRDLEAPIVRIRPLQIYNRIKSAHPRRPSHQENTMPPAMSVIKHFWTRL